MGDSETTLKYPSMSPDSSRILIIDDDDQLRSLLARTLELSGFSQVVQAADGHQGLQLCAAGKFDLVITDIIMPSVDGLEVIFGLRNLNPSAHIIAMSGGGRLDAEYYLDVARTAGATVLRKPFMIPALIEMVRAELAKPRSPEPPAKG